MDNYLYLLHFSSILSSALSGLCSTDSLDKLVLDQVDLGSTAWIALLGALKENCSIRTLR